MDLTKLGFVILYWFYHGNASQDELVERIYGLKEKKKPSCLQRCKKKLLKKSTAVVEPEEAKPADSRTYETSGDCILIDGKEMTTAREQLDSSLDIVDMARDLESIRFILGTLFGHREKAALPTMSWKSSQKKVNLERQFSGTVSDVTKETSKEENNINNKGLVNSLRHITESVRSKKSDIQDDGAENAPRKDMNHPFSNAIKAGLSRPPPDPHDQRVKPTSTGNFVEDWTDTYHQMILSMLPVAPQPIQPSSTKTRSARVLSTHMIRRANVELAKYNGGGPGQNSSRVDVVDWRLSP